MRAAPASLLLLGLVLGVGGCGQPGPEASGPGEGPVAEAPWRGEGDEIEVTVHDLHCAGCELEIEQDLEGIAGVLEVRADHETDVVRIRIEDPATRAEMVTALREGIHAKKDRLVVGEDPIPTGD